MTWGRRWRWGYAAAAAMALLAVIAMAGPAAAQGGGIIYVDPDATGDGSGNNWDNACPDVRTALARRTNQTEMWVAEGTYKPTVDGGSRTVSFVLVNGLALYGGFDGTETARNQRDPVANPTILSGNIGTPNFATDNSYHVVKAYSTITNSAVLDGFTIQDGYGDGNYGGGLNVNGSPTLANLIIRDNYAGSGGGINLALGASPQLSDVEIRDNVAVNNGGGLASISSATPTLTGVLLDGNGAEHGGGMYTSNSSPVLENITFSHNTATQDGGGLYTVATDSSGPTLTSVTFQNNTATVRGGGMYSGGAYPRLNGGTFDGNTATDGGGLYVNRGRPALANLTFTANQAQHQEEFSDGGGLYTYYTDIRLTNVTLADNTADRGGGIYIDRGAPRLTNVVVHRNTAMTEGGGLYATNAAPTLAQTTFTANQAYASGGGIYKASALNLHNSIVWGNSIVGTSTWPQIHNASGTMDIRHSDIEGSGGSGTGWDVALGTDNGGNLDVDPLLKPNQRLAYGSPVVDAGSDALLPADPADLDGDGNTAEALPQDIDGDPRVLYDAVDMGADELLIRVWYVDDDGDSDVDDGCSAWSNACYDLRTVLKEAAGGDEVWVAAGTYMPGLPEHSPNLTFQLKNSVRVYGGFAGTETVREQRDPSANLTLLSGDRDDSGDATESDACHVVNGSGVNDGAVLDGFTISGGNAIYDCVGDDGGGVYVLDGSPILTNLILSGNHADSGGGLYVGGNSRPRIVGVTFTENTAGFGGGLYVDETTTPTLASLTFVTNTAQWGGGLYLYKTNATVTNASFFDNNAASEGGGIFSSDGDPTLINLTVSGNVATVRGGGLMAQRSNPTLVNCILWGNSAAEINRAEIYRDLESTLTIRYSDIRGSGGSASWDTALGTDGGGNVDADPRFVDAAGGDLRLRYDAPVIDAGHSPSATTETDLAGHPRIMGDAVDMGAYEVEQRTLDAPAAGTWLDFGPEVCGSVWFTAGVGTLPTSVAVTLTHETPAGDSLPRRYEITPEGGSGYEARLALCYEDGDLAHAGLDPADEADLHGYRYDTQSGTWVAYSTVDTEANTVTADGVTAFGVWRLGPSGTTAVGVRRLGRGRSPLVWLSPAPATAVGAVLVLALCRRRRR